jgi:hypothetical protein
VSVELINKRVLYLFYAEEDVRLAVLHGAEKTGPPLTARLPLHASRAQN